MKRFLLILAIFALTITACGSAAEPTMNPADVQGTAMAAAMTMVAETQAAIPTATSIPPTEAPSATPFPTNTVAPLDALSPTQAVGGVPTTALGVIPTNTPVQASPGATSDPCNAPLMTWDGPSATINMVNDTKPKGTITLSLYFYQTAWGDCGYIGRQFSGSSSASVPLGTFSAGAFVDGQKDFKVFGGGEINREGNYTLWVTNDSIILKAGCAPNC